MSQEDEAARALAIRDHLLPLIRSHGTMQEVSGMAGRPAGLPAFERAIAEYRIDESALMRFARPVYFSYGSLSNVRWELMADRLAGRFRDIEVERYEGLHHLNTSHAAQPDRVAAALQRLWGRAEESAAERAPVPSP